MLRTVLGIAAGFITWSIVWIGGEKLISAVWPAFGTHQAEFQSAIENGTSFTANAAMLFTHVVLASLVSAIAGFLAALIAGNSRRAPVVLGVLLLIMGMVKMFMTWQYVPVWYHVLFTVVLLPMAVLGGKLRKNA